MAKKMELIAGICFGVVSALQFARFFTNPNLPEADMLKTASVYVQTYEGESAKDALDYVEDTFRVAERNPKLSEGVKGLEKELSQISVEIGESTNPMIYKPVLHDFGERMESIADKNKRNPWILWAGIFNGLASLVWLANPYTWRKEY